MYVFDGKRGEMADHTISDVIYQGISAHARRRLHVVIFSLKWKDWS